MKVSFKPDYGLVYVEARIQGENIRGGFKETALLLALGTGASNTMISARKSDEAGYNLDLPEDEIYITTGSGLIFVPKIKIEKLLALGKPKTILRLSPTICRRQRALTAFWVWIFCARVF